VWIEEDTPIPPKSKGGRRQTPLGKMVRAMKIGHCIVCDTEGEKETVRTLIWQLGGKYQTRKCSDGWRVWRTE